MTDALDNLLKAAKTVARHEQAYRQCARTERWPITMPVGEIFDLSDAVAAMEAAPAAVPALVEVERATAIPMADNDEIVRLVDGLPWEVVNAIVTIRAHCTAIVDTAPPDDVKELAACISQNCLELATALRHPQAPASGEVRTKLADLREKAIKGPMQVHSDFSTCVYGPDKTKIATTYNLAAAEFLCALINAYDSGTFSPSQPASDSPR